MSNHRFTIEVEFDGSEQYEAFVSNLQHFGAEIVDEESDF